MSVGVFTRDTRFEWVKGWLTGGTDPGDGSVEVGAGTAYPLKVTLDQLAEIYYRVTDAKVSGVVSAEYAFGKLNLTTSGGDMPTDRYSGTVSDVIVQRSYATTDAPPQNITNERLMWIGPLKTPEPPIPVSNLVHSEVTGFTHYAESFVLPASGYYPYGVNPTDLTIEYTAIVEFAFGSHVAVTGDGNPLDLANEIWVEFGFFGNTTDGVALLVDAYTLATANINEGPSGDLTIVLSDSEITCALYASNYAFLSSASSTLKITATEWWPYNRLAEPRAIWDAATGEFVPAGAPFAAADIADNLIDLYLLLF